LINLVGASHAGIAGVVRADIRVIAADRYADALALRTGVTRGARVAVVTLLNFRGKRAASGGVAVIERARVSIVAVEGRTSAETGEATAGVSDGAYVSVVAASFERGVDAATLHLTPIAAALVTVVAVKHRQGRATSIFTVIADGAGVAIRTGFQVGDVVAATVGAARIVSAGIGIVTVHRRSGLAHPREAGIIEGA
jgi:hypothetical protein